MQCPEFEQRLNAVLDDRRNPERDSRLSAHAAECDRCRELLDDHLSLLAGLSHMTRPAPRRDLARRVVATALVMMPQAKHSRRNGNSISAWAPVLAAAAVMLLAVSVVRYVRRNGPTTDDPAREVSRLIVGSGGSGLAMTSRGPAGREAAAMSAEWLIEAPRLPSRLRAYRGAIGDIALAIPEAAMRLEEVEQLAAGMRPLRASFAVIWDTFFRSIPAWQVESPRPSDVPTTMRPADLRQVA